MSEHPIADIIAKRASLTFEVVGKCFELAGDWMLNFAIPALAFCPLPPAYGTPIEKLTPAKLAHKEAQDRRNELLWDAYISGKKYRKVERFTHEDKMVARVGYVDARGIHPDRLVNEPMRDELRVRQRVEAMERWYETTGADLKYFHFYKHKEYLAKWFSAPPVMP